MSHFSVIVATKEQPTDDVLSRELQPFHEFECTGTDDKYVVDVDKTDEARAEFERQTETRLKDKDGNLLSFFDDKGNWRPEFSQPDPNAAEWDKNRRTYFVPDGYEKVEVPAAQVQSFADFLEGWYGWDSVAFGQQPDLKGEHRGGYALLDESGEVVKCVDRTNPNAKWDFWRIGGRYAGKFQVKGRAPQRRRDLSWEWDDSKTDERPTGVDSCRKSDLDVAAMKSEAVASRRRWWASCCEQSKLSDDDLLKALAADRTVHARWMQLPEPKPRGGEYAAWSNENGGYKAVELTRLWDKPEIPEGQSLEEWFQASPPLTCFAFLMDGKWAEKSEMGWWGCVSNENADWHQDFMRIFEMVPSDYWLTVVDCHI